MNIIFKFLLQNIFPSKNVLLNISLLEMYSCYRSFSLEMFSGYDAATIALVITAAGITPLLSFLFLLFLMLSGLLDGEWTPAA